MCQTRSTEAAASCSPSSNPKTSAVIRAWSATILLDIDLPTDQQQPSYSLLHKLYRITTSSLQRQNASIMAALSVSPPSTAGGWGWVYNSASTIRHGAKKDTDTTVRKTKLSLDWNEHSRFLPWARLPPATPRQPPPARQATIHRPAFRPSRTRLVSVKRCKPCRSPDGTTDLPKYLLRDLTTYVLTAFAASFRPTT